MGSEGQGRSKLTVLEVWSLHLLPEHHLGKYKLPSPQLLPTFCIRKTESVVQHSVLRSPGNFDSCFCWRTKFWKKDMQTLTESPDSKHFRFYEPRGKRTRTYSLKRESKQHSHMWAHDLFVCLFVRTRFLSVEQPYLLVNHIWKQIWQQVFLPWSECMWSSEGMCWGLRLLPHNSFFKGIEYDCATYIKCSRDSMRDRDDVTAHLNWSAVTMLDFSEPSDPGKPWSLR